MSLEAHKREYPQLRLRYISFGKGGVMQDKGVVGREG